MHKNRVATIAEATKKIEDSVLMRRCYWFDNMRLRLVQHVIDALDSSKASLLDFGCGRGMQLAQLKKSHPHISYTGYEPYLTSTQVDSSIPLFRNLSDLAGKRFNFIAALDVIEHIEDDLQALRNIHGLLAENGVLIINVPAYMHLWCSRDTIYGHYRRYTKRNLTAMITEAGYEVIEAFYIFPYAWPAGILRRYIYKVLTLLDAAHDDNTVMRYLPIDPLKIPSLLVALELMLIKKTGYRSPFGTSVFLYAIKH